MIRFFAKNTKNYPEFWEEYKSKFQQKLPEYVQDTRFVIFDTETTGFDFRNDRILSIGAVTLENNVIVVSQAFEVYIDQEAFNPDTVEIHGIIKDDEMSAVTEKEAVVNFINYIGNAVLVAHHAQFDIHMINYALKRLGLPKLKNKVIDTMVLYRATRINSNLIDRNKQYSLDEVAENLNISVKDRHTAAGDAMITAIAFLKIVPKLNQKKKLKYLFRIK